MSSRVHDAVVEYLQRTPIALVPPNDVLSWARTRLMGFTPSPATKTTVYQHPAGNVEFVEMPDFEVDNEQLTQLIAASETEADMWDACRLAVEGYYSQHKPLPARLAQWTLDVLDGKRLRPKRRGGAKEDRANRNTARNIRIRGAVELAMEVGNLPAYAPWESGTKTACHIVAECLVELRKRKHPAGANLSYEAVKKIWLAPNRIPTAGRDEE